ncbi:MAG: PKD domain-containing protein [Planctomycetota bacterium]|jgi:hypothetical protein
MKSNHRIKIAITGTLSLACLILSQAACPAATYYVATNGDDSNPGTELEPFQRFQKGMNSARDGDTVFVKAGVYDLSGYSKDIDYKISLIGEDKCSTVLKNGGTITFHDGIAVKNLKFTDYYHAVFKPQAREGETIDGVYFEDCVFENVRLGIYTGKDSQGAITNVHISNCEFLNMRGTSVNPIVIFYALISDIHITNNIFKNLISDGHVTAIYVGSNRDVRTTRDVFISGNYMDTIIGSTEVIDGNGHEVHGILAYGTNLNILNNAVIDLNAGQDHEAIYMKGANSVISDNVMINCNSNQGAIAIKGEYISHHNTISKNRIQSDRPGLGRRALYTAGADYITMADNYIKSPYARWGLYIYEAHGTPCFVNNNYSETKDYTLSLRNSSNGEILGNLFISYQGKTMYFSETTDNITISGNTEYREQPSNPPTAEASADVVQGEAPLTVNFSSDGSNNPNGSIVSYEWNFHDGTVSSDRNPTHTYNEIRTYVATLIVTDSNGFKDMDYVAIRVARRNRGRN